MDMNLVFAKCVQWPMLVICVLLDACCGHSPIQSFRVSREAYWKSYWAARNGTAAVMDVREGKVYSSPEEFIKEFETNPEYKEDRDRVKDLG
jgi:hypothetical protein